MVVNLAMVGVAEAEMKSLCVYGLNAKIEWFRNNTVCLFKLDILKHP